MNSLGPPHHSRETPPMSLTPSPSPSQYRRDLGNTDQKDEEYSASMLMRPIAEYSNKPEPAGTPRPTDPKTQSLLSRTTTPPGILEQLGWWIVFTNITALLVMLLAVSVLCLLWFPIYGETNSWWQEIVTNGRAAQVITVSTLVIRTCIGVSSGTATAMLASLALEGKGNSGILLSKAPELSLARFAKPDPFLSLFPFWTSFWKTKSLLSSLMLLAILTTASQLASTLLLWDVGSHPVPESSTDKNILFGFEMEKYISNDTRTTLEQSVDYWNAAPFRNYPDFLQWREEITGLPNHVKDTGPTIRGLLPISSQMERERLTEFTGKSSLFDNRVACIRPKFLNYTFNSSTFEGRFFHGNLTEDLKKLLVSNSSQDAEHGFGFSADLFALEFDGVSFQILTMPLRYGGLVNSLDPMNNMTLNHFWNFTGDKWAARQSERQLSWNVEVGHVSFFMKLQKALNSSNGPQPETLQDTTRERGVWMDFYDKKGNRMSITACYDAL